MQQTDDFAILAFDVLRKLLTSNWQGLEEALDDSGGAFLRRDNRGAFQLPRNLKVESLSLRSLVCLSSQDMKA